MSIYDTGALPVGFGFRLAMDVTAMERFAALSEEEKENLVAYVQGGDTSEEAERRVEDAIGRLHTF